MELSLHDYVVERLQAYKYRWPHVARETGVSRRTIEKIARREIADPGITSIEKLARFFRENEAA